MREALRDKSRDKMAASLEAAGLQAEIVDRELRRPEEKLRTSHLFGKHSSLGLIDIRTAVSYTHLTLPTSDLV